ncbi:hypothetical protein CONLIGDRAFT_637251 [Coniochaeta ligniaria NRRL 30616]|uniref:Uncharacterized protein n=1 Tax=Coniochaeta ligniaria NRRL 30616 TaxID=1408157 RepID=A0A1J7I9M2_9PEZI|nr:hypothetical protein CONLIGDRAFT_637251 [Coniochaeta ligniaria NRRL 30616]
MGWYLGHDHGFCVFHDLVPRKAERQSRAIATGTLSSTTKLPFCSLDPPPAQCLYRATIIGLPATTTKARAKSDHPAPL